MALKLKQYRVHAGLTQARLAKAAGVSLPDYRQWESGAVPVPEKKLKKLAKVLDTSAEALMGRHPPVEARLYDKSVGEDLNYYGEVAIHFRGGGKSLLLSISDGAFERLHQDLLDNPPFVIVQSLANQTLILRTRAIADLYFSSEAYDDFGPEHETYDGFQILLPDPRDWEIVEALACDGEGLDEFAPEDVQRVSKRVMITDEQYETLVAEGKISPDELEREKEKNQEKTDRIFDLAVKTTYQLSSGQLRSISSIDPATLFEAFREFVDFDGDMDVDEEMAEGLLCLPAAGWHRTIFINKDALDYVILPTHGLEQGRIESEAEMLEEEQE
ncbi:MAG: helix-turn-helix domain-containing protein [Azoarcus sp.]|jgi:transcriptional regulator with XRE-family HTH domain|nr:helix-turn-helix domain-containing protein [Azoarcus sp.]